MKVSKQVVRSVALLGALALLVGLAPWGVPAAAAEETERLHLPRRRPAFMSQRKEPSPAQMWRLTRMITTVLMN